MPSTMLVPLVLLRPLARMLVQSLLVQCRRSLRLCRKLPSLHLPTSCRLHLVSRVLVCRQVGGLLVGPVGDGHRCARVAVAAVLAQKLVV